MPSRVSGTRRPLGAGEGESGGTCRAGRIPTGSGVMIRFYPPVEDDEEIHELLVPRQHERRGTEVPADGEPPPHQASGAV